MVVGDLLNEACLASESSHTLYAEWDRWGQRPRSGFNSPEALLRAHGFSATVSVFGDDNVHYGRIPDEYKAAMAAVARNSVEVDPIPRNFVFCATSGGRPSLTSLPSTYPTASNGTPSSNTAPSSKQTASGPTARYMKLYAQERQANIPTEIKEMAAQNASQQAAGESSVQSEGPPQQDLPRQGWGSDADGAFRRALSEAADDAEAELEHLETFVMPGKLSALHRLLMLAKKGSM